MAGLPCSCTCRVLIIVPHLENYGPLPLYPYPHIQGEAAVCQGPCCFDILTEFIESQLFKPCAYFEITFLWDLVVTIQKNCQ